MFPLMILTVPLISTNWYEILHMMQDTEDTDVDEDNDRIYLTPSPSPLRREGRIVVS
jgi:hypothetical protein